MKKTSSSRMAAAKSAHFAMPLQRAGSTFSDSNMVQPRSEFNIYGPSTPQGPISPDDTPQS